MASLAGQQEDKAVGVYGVEFLSLFPTSNASTPAGHLSLPPQALLKHHLPRFAHPAPIPLTPHAHEGIWGLCQEWGCELCAAQQLR